MNAPSACLPLLLLAALATSPDTAAQSTETRFAAWDRNDDNALSLDEFSAEARSSFDAMDADRNGNLTAAEMDAADAQSEGEMSAAQKIALLDDNEDGILSIDEYQADVEKRFGFIDANDDDSVSPDELRSGWSVPVPTP